MSKKRINPPENNVPAIQLQYHGPVPPAAEMKAFQEIDPSIPVRLLIMAENEQQNRHKVDSYNHEIAMQKIAAADAETKNNELRIRLDARNTLIGLVFAFVICILVISGSVVSF